MKPSMPKDLKDKWLAALRSGEYKQCKGTLSDGEGYCCLGVLQMVADGRVERFNGVPEAVPTISWYGRHHIGILDDLRAFSLKDGCRALAEMNDGGLSFKEVADAIERGVEGV